MYEAQNESSPTPEQKIVMALLAEVRDAPDVRIEHRLHDENTIFIVVIRRIPIELDEDKGSYFSLGPPGKVCACCKGSGKRL